MMLLILISKCLLGAVCELGKGIYLIWRFEGLKLKQIVWNFKQQYNIGQSSAH